MNRRRIIDRLERDATTIVAGYTRARHQLTEWQAGHPATVIGASPPTGSIINDEDPAKPDPKAGTPAPDRATTLLADMDRTLTRLAANGRTMWADHDGAAIPEPAATVAARLAVVMWTVRRTQRDLDAINDKKLDNYARDLARLADLVTHNQPPTSLHNGDICHAHKAAGNYALEDAPIDRNYRRWHLCRWCGDFRNLHGTTPPARLIRLHDRGIRITPSLLRSAGIRTSA